jgi:MucR family transcriptional regulator, transcriptional regulator of exopolysaccharide biosynthesis
MPASDKTNHIDLTAEIVSAFVGNNAVTRSDLTVLIESVHAALMRVAGGASIPGKPEALVPAVSVRSSVKPDWLVCLDDGKKFKSLKRHLTALGMTPEQYRAKWKLPPDYPMVAPNYAAQRSALAKKIGLGQRAGDVVKRNAAKSKTDKPRRVRPSKASPELPAA